MRGSNFATAAVRRCLPPLPTSTLSVLLVLSLAVEVVAEQPFDQPFQLHVGESVAVGMAGLEIGFTGVPYDGRCPIDERCVYAGNAIANIWADDPTRNTTGFQLHTGSRFPRQVTYGSYHIKLLGIVPRPQLGVLIDPSEYVVVLIVKVQHYVGCGWLIQGAECVLYLDEQGGMYSLDDYGHYSLGEHVQVVGTLGADCTSFCMQAHGCIVNNMVGLCSGMPVESSTWGRVKALFIRGPTE